jgi:hypothetical protein
MRIPYNPVIPVYLSGKEMTLLSFPLEIVVCPSSLIYHQQMSRLAVTAFTTSMVCASAGFGVIFSLHCGHRPL